MEIYQVQQAQKPIEGVVMVPGSKSVTNRALFMAAMAEGRSVLTGALFSEDSRYFLKSLQALGYEAEADEEKKCIRIEGTKGRIPRKEGSIYVGSAGTAARFLTAFAAMSDGCYEINASVQMAARPMKALFDALTELGAEFEFLGAENHLPVRVKGRKYGKQDKGISKQPALAHVDISESTQFLSALLMAGVLIEEGLDIAVTSSKTDGSYIRITLDMMKDFGCEAVYDPHHCRTYHIQGGQAYRAGKYNIEPDISAACYFWAMAAVTGGSVAVRGTRRGLMQGDMKFLDVLSCMGCTVEETPEGIRVSGPREGRLAAAAVDMNDFSDQTMTLAAIAPFADGTTYIRNIGHIRRQESDRIQAILENLQSMGIECGTIDDGGKEGIFIRGGKPKGACIKTFEDHRMAMAFAVTGLRVAGISIENPMCCKKTFEDYFKVLEDLLGYKK